MAQHLSIRVPWKDNGYTGFICDKQMVIALGAIPAAVLLVGGLLEFFLLKKAVKNKSRK